TPPATSLAGGCSPATPRRCACKSGLFQQVKGPLNRGLFAIWQQVTKRRRCKPIAKHLREGRSKRRLHVAHRRGASKQRLNRRSRAIGNAAVEAAPEIGEVRRNVKRNSVRAVPARADTLANRGDLLRPAEAVHPHARVALLPPRLETNRGIRVDEHLLQPP